MNAGTDTSTKVVVTAIFGNTAVTISKFIGWFLTGSASMLAEAIHSSADTCNQILLFVGIKRSKGGPSKLFPWGTGQARYIWNLVSAMGIFFIGFGVTVYHGVHTLLHPPEINANSSISTSLWILLFAFVVEGYALWVAIKEVNHQRGSAGFLRFLKHSDDPTTLGVLFEDGIAVLGVLVAATCIWLSNYLQSSTPDAIGSIIIGVLLGIMALYLSKINGTLLMGAAANPIKEKKIKDFIESFPEVEQIANMKTVVLGSGQLHLAVEVELHGEHLINRDQIRTDAEKIRDGHAPTPILVDTAERMVRVVGEKINDLEYKIKQKFPDVSTIEFEIH